MAIIRKIREFLGIEAGMLKKNIVCLDCGTVNNSMSVEVESESQIQQQK